MALKDKGLLVVLSGPSGCGKDTIISALKERNLPIKQSISMTTRTMRPDESEGVDYFFTDVKTFEQNIDEDFFLEYVKYGENYYGTPREAVNAMLDAGIDVLLKIEVEGAGNIRRFYPDAVSVFIIPPSLEVLSERLRGRGTETQDDFNRRLNIAEQELKRAPEYDYVVINDELESCVGDICAILKAEHFKYDRMSQYINEF